MVRQYNRAKAYEGDSKWEVALKNGVMKDFKYHPKAIEYTIPESLHKYSPDWVIVKPIFEIEPIDLNLGTPITITRNFSQLIYVEAKGRFRSREEMNKYIHIKASLSSDEELVFLFQKPKLPVFGASKRKDGTRMSHAEWAEKQGFKWFTEQTIGELLK